MNTKKKIGVVLAGGLSSRMGRDKALLDWQGVSLLDHMCRLLLETGVERVVVSGDRPGYDCVPDAETGRGPGFALSGLLAALPAESDALIVPVDMPLLTPVLLRRLLSHRAAYFATYPLPASLPARSPSAEPLQSDTIKGLHRIAGSVALPISPEEEALLLNGNTPDEWRRIRLGRQA